MISKKPNINKRSSASFIWSLITTYIKYIAAVIVSIFIIFIICSIAYKFTSHSIPQHKQLPDTLHVAIELSSLTLSTNGDSIDGFSYRVMKEICESHNIPFRYKVFNNIEDAFINNQEELFDVYITNIPITTQIKEDYLVTVPLYTDKQLLIQNKQLAGDSLITNHIQLARHDVWIPKRSPILDRMENLSNELGEDISIIEVDTLTEEQLGILVALGDIPRAVISESIARFLSTKYDNLDMGVKLSFPQFRAWFIDNSDSLLLDTINVWINDFKSKPRFAELIEQYEL